MTFAELHRPGDPFVLPNAWDVGTARALVAAGFPAVGTTSLGVAAAHGLPDATGAARAAVVDLARALHEADLGRPVSCDLEDGFDTDPGAVADLVASLDVAGVNLEDATGGVLVDPDLHVARIRAVKARCPDVFVNARTDVFWLGHGTLADAVERLRRYADAGADGVFAPGVPDLATIEAIVHTVPAPLNVLASAAFTRRQFADAGVARISTGSLLYRAALTRVVDTALAVRDGQPLPPAVSYQEVQALHEGVRGTAGGAG